MDEKGRVSLPSAFRREADGDRFVLLQWRAPALTLFPVESWAAAQGAPLDVPEKSTRGLGGHTGHYVERGRGLAR